MGHDNVLILADKHTVRYLRGRVPDDVILEADIYDIWMRHFAPILTKVGFVACLFIAKTWEQYDNNVKTRKQHVGRIEVGRLSGYSQPQKRSSNLNAEPANYEH